MAHLAKQSLRLGDMYLHEATHILCLATHSKLGLTTFVEALRARHHISHSRRQILVIDGGMIGHPVEAHLPQSVQGTTLPSDIILLAHPQDPPRLLEGFSAQLHQALLGIRCYFHIAGTDLDIDISN